MNAAFRARIGPDTAKVPLRAPSLKIFAEMSQSLC